MSEETLEKVVVSTSKELVVLNEDILKKERKKIHKNKYLLLSLISILCLCAFTMAVTFSTFPLGSLALAFYVLFDLSIRPKLEKWMKTYPLYPNGMKPVHAFVEEEDYIIVCNGKVVKEEFGVPVKYILDNYDEVDDGEDVVLDLTAEDKAFEEELNNVIKQYEEAQDGS